MTPQPKSNTVRLTPSKYKKLKDYIKEREGGCCIVTGKPTDDKPHHIVYTSQGGSDVKENLCLVDWFDFHFHVHNDPRKAIEIIGNYYSDKQIIKYFLLGLVGEREVNLR